MLIVIYNLDVNKKRKHGCVIHIYITFTRFVYVHNMFELYGVADIRCHIHITVSGDQYHLISQMTKL